MKKFDFLAFLIPVSFIAIIVLTIIQTPRQKAIIQTKAQTPPTPIIVTSQVKNPDGDITLTLTKTSTPGSETTYALSVTDSHGTVRNIVEEVLQTGQDVVLPRNSWSNDNNKFFIQKVTPEGDKYYVFRADGKTFSDGQPFLEVNHYWTKYSKKLKIKTLTGWADKDLIIVYTTDDSGGEGPSFWFVVSTKQFLQLANHPTD